MGHFDRRLNLAVARASPPPDIEAFFAELIARLDRDTAVIRAHRVIAGALIDARTFPTMAEPTKPPLNLPNLAGVTGAFEKLRHGIETRAERLMNRIEGTDARADNVFKKAGAKLDTHDEALKSIDGFLEHLDELGNGAPADSGGSSTASPVAEHTSE